MNRLLVALILALLPLGAIVPATGQLTGLPVVDDCLAGNDVGTMLPVCSTLAGEVPSGDGLVGSFSISQPGSEFPIDLMANAPVILYEGNGLAVSATLLQRTGETYGPFTGTATLFIQRDCGLVAAVLEPLAGCQVAMDVVASDTQDVSAGDVEFTISDEALTDVFPSTEVGSLPLAALHFFIQVGDQYTHLLAPNQILPPDLLVSAAAEADASEELTFTPVLFTAGQELPVPAPEGDDLVAVFTLPDPVEVGLLPVLTVQDPLTITVDAYHADGSIFTDDLQLVIKVDCSHLEPVLGQVAECDPLIVPAIPASTQEGNTYNFIVPLGVQEGLFTAPFPITATNLFVETPGGAHASHYNLAAQLIALTASQSSEASPLFALANALEGQTFTPVLLLQAPEGMPTPDGFVASIQFGAVGVAPVFSAGLMEVQVYTATGTDGAFEPAEFGEYNLVLQVDCGALAEVVNGIAPGTCAGGEDVETLSQVYPFTASATGNTIEVSQADLDVLLNGLPVTALHIFVEGTVDGEYAMSNFATPTALLLSGGPEAAAIVDLVDAHLWHPVIVLGGAGLPPVGAGGDGYFVLFGADVMRVADNLLAGTPPYTFRVSEEGTITVDGVLYNAVEDAYVPTLDGTVTVYIELDCGALAEVAVEACLAAGVDGRQISKSGDVDPGTGSFAVTFDDWSELSLAVPLPYLPVHVFVTHDTWRDGDVQQHSHFNAPSQALGRAILATSAEQDPDFGLPDAMEDSTFTPVLLPVQQAAEEPECDPMDPTTLPDCDPVTLLEGLVATISGVLCSEPLSMIFGNIPDLCEPTPEEFTVDAGGPYEGEPGQPIEITATGSPSDGVTCEWNGAGATFANSNACATTVTFATEGDFTITVEATRNDETAEDEATVTVADAPSEPGCDPMSPTTWGTTPLCQTIPPDGVAPALGDGFFAHWGTNLMKVLDNLQGQTLPYQLHYNEAGELSLDGTLFGPDGYTPVEDGLVTVYLELDCGGLAALADEGAPVCEGLDGTRVFATTTSDEGSFSVNFTADDLAPLFETGAAVNGNLPVHLFVTHEDWLVGGEAEHSHFNAVAQAIAGPLLNNAPLTPLVALADALEDLTFTPLLLPEPGTPSEPGGSPVDCVAYIVEEEEAVYLQAWQDCYRFLTGGPAPEGCEDPVFAVLGIAEQLEACLLGDEPQPVLPVVAIVKVNDAAEPATNGKFKVTADPAPESALVVTYEVAIGDGQATPGADYDSLPGTVTIPAGQTGADIVVTVTDDNLDESAETVQLTLNDGDSYNLGSPSAAELSIGDNDPVVSQLPASLSGFVGQPIQLDVNPSGGVGPYTCEFTGPEGAVFAGEADSCSRSVTFGVATGEAPHQVNVSVSDSASGPAKATIADQVNVTIAPFLAGISVSEGPYFVSREIELTAFGQGGTQPYTCAWSYTEESVPGQFSSQDSCTTSVRFTESGSFEVEVLVQDASAEYSDSASTPLVVQVRPVAGPNPSSESTTSASSTPSSLSSTTTAPAPAQTPDAEQVSDLNPALLTTLQALLAGVDVTGLGFLKDADGRVVGIQDSKNVFEELQVASDQGLALVRVRETGVPILLDVVNNQALPVEQPVVSIVQNEVAAAGGDLVVSLDKQVNGWIQVTMDDLFPDQPVRGVLANEASGAVRSIPASLIWREGGKLHFLDDPTITYTVSFAPTASLDPNAVTASNVDDFPWAAVLLGALLVLASAAVLVLVVVRNRNRAQDEAL